MERHHNGLAVKVSQLQAILSRRCVAIGNVQQQFLRASGVDGAGVGGLRVVGGHWGVVLDVGEEGGCYFEGVCVYSLKLVAGGQRGTGLSGAGFLRLGRQEERKTHA